MHHNPLFFVLSVVIAVLGSWTALDLFRRVRANRGNAQAAWLFAAALAMGLSIWSMHFIAMLGFDPGVPVRYDPGLTLLSLALAIAATGYAFFTAIRVRGPVLLFLPGLVMGAGICVMHYVGMAALRAPVSVSYQPLMVGASFAVAVAASTSALIVAWQERSRRWRAGAAVVLGFAIVGMHYTGMAAVRIGPAGVGMHSPGGLELLTLAANVAGGTALLLFLALLAALFDRRFELHAAQEANRREDQIRAILEHLPVGVFVVKPGDENLRFANAEAQRLFGLAGGRVALTGDDQYPPSPTAPTALLANALRSGQPVGPWLQSLAGAGGSTSTFEVRVAPLRGGGQDEDALAIVALLDVTAQLEGQAALAQAAALRQSEERFRQITEDAPVMLWMCDADGRSLYLNKAMRDFWDAPDSRSDFDWTAMIHRDDRELLVKGFRASLARQRNFREEARFLRADGEVRNLVTEGHARRGPTGEFQGLIGVSVDVTETRRAELDQLRANDLLERRVREAVAQKQDLEAVLAHSQQLEALGRLTGGVAHDFNNLLTVMIGALDMILNTEQGDERRRRLGEAALAAAKRAERLTAQLLAFSRRQMLRPEVCDLNALIAECEPLLRRAAGEGREFHVSYAEDNAGARVDPAQFEAALLNLIVNAADATPAGGRISIDIAPCRLESEEAADVRAGGYMQVRVSDTGEGMPPDVMDKVFEPFFTTKAVGKGTGLGLSQVYGFVRQSGGGVTVESRQGEGTAFSIFLPAAHAAEATPELSQAPPVRQAQALRVLLVDDDPEVAEIAEAMLQDLGHTVRAAHSADEALALIRSNSGLDLLISDVVMPGSMNGVELAHAAVAEVPGLKVLLSSGYAGADLDPSLAEAPWPLLPKPYQKAELAEQIEQVISRE